MMARLLKYQDIKNLLTLQKAEADSPHITLLLDTLTARFEDYLQCSLEKKARTEIYCGTGRMVRLNAVPIDTGATITVIQDGTAVDASDYEVRSFGLLLKSQQCSFDKPVTTTYTGGYTATVAGGETVLNIPDSMKRAALMQLTHDINTFKKPGADSIQTDAGTITTPPMKLLDEVKTILNPYIHPMRLI
jgi:hypothetical protein